MKSRTGFVSNSSSSSFIVIGTGSALYVPDKEVFFHDGYYSFGKMTGGQHTFGREDEMYTSVFAKINFAYIQAYYMREHNNTTYMEMLEDVLKDKLNLDYIEWDFDTMKSYDFYIDHQSASYEGQNMEMFVDKETLINFLFDADSYIQCGNDNS